MKDNITFEDLKHKINSSIKDKRIASTMKDVIGSFKTQGKTAKETLDYICNALKGMDEDIKGNK
jgi:hypothetical protein